MPTKPKVFRPAGKTAAQTNDKRRGSSRKRGYDSRWERERKWFIKQPECIVCACGCGRLSEMVDHIVAVSGPSDPRFYDKTNLQALTHECHNAKTIRFDGGMGRQPDRSVDGAREMARMLAAAKARAAKIDARLEGSKTTQLPPVKL